MSNNDKIKLELLAPAKDKTCAITAIKAGADAVYIGANAFGARHKAGNSLKDIKEIIDFAHLFNAKVYVTVNTIFFDNELSEVQKLIQALYEIKTDAIIFQDFSVLNMDLPPIELHASTQCHNISVDKINFLQQCNVKRVVLPREFSLRQIKEVKDSTDIEIEAFCHGALCVSYSGQCYLSDFIGKRSANRGECAQPCRKKYSLMDKNGKFYAQNSNLLCLKDFNLSEKMPELIKSGATSFKIEGRLKDENYVKNTVLAYNRILNDFISQNSNYERQSFGKTNSDFYADLNKTFNRGYCTHFIEGKPDKITSFDTPKFKGEFIGKVKSVKNNEIIIDTNLQLNTQDGITYFYNDELSGTKVINAQHPKYKLLSAKNISVGTNIYRNCDNEYISELENFELSRKLPVDFDIICEPKAIKIKAKSGLTEVQTDFCDNFEPAQKQDLAVENFKKQFSKLGNTNFYLNSVTITGDFIPHLKFSQINELRTQITDTLQNKILSLYTPRKRNLNFEIPEYPVKNLDYSYNVSNYMAKQFYEKCRATVEQSACEITNKYKKLMVTKHCLKREFNLCGKKTEQLYLVDEFGKKYPLNFDCANCQMEIFAPEL